ncbi:MAG: helix-turn-helix transcriptional regulator [Steroidobacteraceae bacterium]
MREKQESTKTLPDNDIRRFYTADPEQPFLPGQGMRYRPTLQGANGYRDLIEVTPGFMLVVGDVRHESSSSITADEDPVLKIHYRLSGAGRAALEGHREIEIAERSSTLLMHPEGLRKVEWFLAGQHEQSVTLLCQPGFLKGRMADVLSRLPPLVAEFLEGGGEGVYHESMPLRADMARAAAALLACELTGSLRRLYAEGKAYELLTLSLQALVDADQDNDQRDSGLTQRDFERLAVARQILERDFLNPPSIAGLAREVGINEAKLMRAFKHLYGRTIFDFAQQLRMERAKKLLEATDLSVTDIALEVGYEYSSNFTTAFKRHFGITPKAARDAVK